MKCETKRLAPRNEPPDLGSESQNSEEKKEQQHDFILHERKRRRGSSRKWNRRRLSRENSKIRAGKLNRTTTATIKEKTTSRKFIGLFILFDLLLLSTLLSLQSDQSTEAEYVEFNPEQIEDLTSMNLLMSEEQSTQTNAFFEDPQPLVSSYVSSLHDAGSGMGFPSQSQSQFAKQPQFNYDTSSVSPSLITAKCWNNYENDNDCKQLNVITSPNSDQTRLQQQQQQNQYEDNSIITPVVIFESASTLEPPPHQQNPFNNYYQQPSNIINNQNNQNQNNNNNNNQSPPAYLAPPYFSSTSRPDTSNVLLARHRTPPTANDIYAATPAGATLMPSDGSEPSTLNYNQDFNNNIGFTTQVTINMSTRPTTSIYVATPQPGKTTTTGRTCRDENDEDCDEPTEESAKGGADDGGDDGETDSGDGDDTGDSDININNNINIGNKSKSSHLPSVYDRNNNEVSDNIDSGSGEGPANGDDSEDDGDDNGDEGEGGSQNNNKGGARGRGDQEGDLPEGSGENSTGVGLSNNNRLPSSTKSNESDRHETASNRYFEVTSYRPTQGSEFMSTSTQATSTSTATTTTKRPGANIEVVFHPTLPPSFPITTTSPSIIATHSTSRDNQQYQPEIRTTSVTPPTTTTGDTVTSRPVYPSTNHPINPNDELNPTDEDGLALTPPVTVDPNPSIILLPMGGERNFSQVSQVPQTNGGGGGGKSQPNNGDSGDKLNPMNRFVPNSTPKPYVPFGNPWTHTRTPQPPLNIYTAESPLTTLGPSGRDGNKLLKSDTVQKSQPEILSTLLLWSSILILVTTAFIFVCLSIGFWRRNTARQRAFLHKANLMNNGAGGQIGGPNQMVGSMSHGSHLLANMQQPGLLTTYSPLNQGMNLGKVTTSVIKAQPADIMPLEEDEDEDEERESKDGLLMDGSLNGNDMNGNNVNIISSTEDQQTTSSGSQRTNDSVQGVAAANLGNNGLQMGNNNNHHHAMNNRSQYPNSLSDGRQNSSSISDSQSSPDNTETHNLHMQPKQMQQFNNNNNGYPNMHNNTNNSIPPQAHRLDQRAPMQQQQMHPLGGMNHHQQPLVYSGQHQPPYLNNNNNNQRPPRGFVASSRSVEDLQRGAAPPTAMIMMGPPPPMSLHRQINGNGIGSNGGHVQLTMRQPFPQSFMPPVANMNGGGDNGQIFARPPVPLPMNGNGFPHKPPMRPPLMDYPQFNQPISPSRVAMNPLATLSRRYPTGAGLNRNIYSEDSSSFMTTSPSLARTSSSSSFAFANSAKSSLLNYNMGNSGQQPPVPSQSTGPPVPPPVMGRRDRSEAWYL